MIYKWSCKLNKHKHRKYNETNVIKLFDINVYGMY